MAAQAGVLTNGGGPPVDADIPLFLQDSQNRTITPARKLIPCVG